MKTIPFLAAILCYALLSPRAHAAGPNLARNMPCKASSVEGMLTPGKAVDGPKSQASRWGSNYQTDKNKDSAWIFVDLGRMQTVDSVAIYWEHSGARQFAVQSWRSEADTPSYSDAGWETLLYDTTLVYQNPPVDMCLSFLKIKPTATRYLRIRCYKRMFTFGFSIMELEVYGPGTSALPGRSISRGERDGRVADPQRLFSVDGRLAPRDSKAYRILPRAFR